MRLHLLFVSGIIAAISALAMDNPPTDNKDAKPAVAPVKTETTSKTNTIDPYGIEPVMNGLEDIRLLDIITPYKFNSKQIEAIIKALDAAETKIKAQQKSEAQEILKYKDAVAKQRAECIKGKVAPKTHYDTFKAIFDKYAENRAKLRYECVTQVGKEIKPLLTSEQIKLIIKDSEAQLKEENDPGLAKATEDQKIWFFVERVLFCSRTHVLLNELLVIEKQKEASGDKKTENDTPPINNEQPKLSEPAKAE